MKRARSVARPDLGSVLLFALTIVLALAVVALDDTLGPLAALAAPLAAATLLAALRDYRVATCLTMFLLPFAPTNLVPREMIGMSGANLVLILLAITASALLLTGALRRGRLALPRWPRVFFLYCAVFVAAAVHGAFHAADIPDFLVALHVIDSTSVRTYLQIALIYPSAYLIAALLVSVALRNATRPNLYLLPLFGGACVLACAVIYYALGSGASVDDLASQDSRQTLSVIGLHANELGLLLNTGWALALFCFLQTRRLRMRLALGAVGVLLLAGIALTFSRGAYLGTLAVLAFMLYARRRFVTFVLTLLVLAAALVLMPQGVSQRALHETGSNDVDSLSSGRVDEIWKPLLPEILGSPLVGSGTGSVMWSEANKEHQILPVGHPHSAYLGALLDLGVLGTIVVLLFLHHAWRLFRRLAEAVPDPLWRGFFNGGAACILLLLVQGLTDDGFLPGRTHALLWLAYGAAVGHAGRLKANIQARARPPRRAAPARLVHR